MLRSHCSEGIFERLLRSMPPIMLASVVVWFDLSVNLSTSRLGSIVIPSWTPLPKPPHPHLSPLLLLQDLDPHPRDLRRAPFLLHLQATLRLRLATLLRRALPPLDRWIFRWQYKSSRPISWTATSCLAISLSVGRL